MNVGSRDWYYQKCISCDREYSKQLMFCIQNYDKYICYQCALEKLKEQFDKLNNKEIGNA